MDIFELLKKDHERVLGIFEELEEAEGETAAAQDGKQDKLFGRLKQELWFHMNGEEEVFYPALENEEETRSVILESIEEHHVVRVLLEELDKIPKNECWVAKLSVLRENVRHHIDKEEGDVFQEAQEILSEDRVRELGRRMAEYRKGHTARR